MKPLELLKQKLMIKPTIKENEPVIVAINVGKEGNDVIQETEEEIKNRPTQKTLIVDETNKEELTIAVTDFLETHKDECPDNEKNQEHSACNQRSKS